MLTGVSLRHNVEERKQMLDNFWIPGNKERVVATGDLDVETVRPERRHRQDRRRRDGRRYRARDTKLDRDVALKVLTGPFAEAL